MYFSKFAKMFCVVIFVLSVKQHYTVDRSTPFASPAASHFVACLKRFGSPVICLNLVKVGGSNSNPPVRIQIHAFEFETFAAVNKCVCVCSTEEREEGERESADSGVAESHTVSQSVPASRAPHCVHTQGHGTHQSQVMGSRNRSSCELVTY